MHQQENSVVSVTPTAVARDSRTFKQAASIARMGMRSIVVEGQASPAREEPPPFELASVGPALPPPPAASASGSLGALGRARHAAGAAAEPLVALAGNLRWNARTLGALPPADLYVVHGWSQLPAAWRAARRNRAAVLYDAHDSYFEHYPPGEDPYASPLTRAMFATLEGMYARRAGGFLTVTEGVADLLEQRMGRRPRVLYNYPDLRMDLDGAGDVRDAVGAGEREFLLVSVGNAKAGMDVEAGVEAIGMLPERYRLALVGNGLDAYEHLVREAGLEDRVHVLPPVAPDQVNRFIRGADAGVILYYGITRDFEVALPNRLFHAIAAGLPLLYPPLPEIAAVAERHGLGLPIDPRDPASIAQAARSLGDDRDAAARYARAAVEATAELSWERQEPLLERAIRDALRDGRPGRQGAR